MPVCWTGPIRRMAERRPIAENRRARHLYDISETVEVGLVLLGSEVKSLRAGKANIAEAYVSFGPDGPRLINATIPTYAAAGRFGHDDRRPRPLLLRRREINRLAGEVTRKGKTVVPLRLFFNDRGRVKLEIGLGRGRKLHDKREVERRRDWNRQKERLLRRGN